MVLSNLDIIIIISFLLILFTISFSYRNKASKNIESFFLGGRNLPWWIAGTSMVATTFAADTPLAVTEMIAKDGIAGNWLWWNMLAGGLLTTFFFAKLWRRADVLTDVELIEMRYSGLEARILRVFRACYLGLFMNCIVIGWVNLALVSLIEIFFGVSYEHALIYTGIAMLMVVLYSSVSGLLGVAITDAVQFVVAMVGCIVLAILVVNDDKIGGIQQLKAQLPANTLNFFPVLQLDTPLKNTKVLTLGIGSFLAYISIWWTSWYPGAEPGGGGYIAQRMMSTKDESHALKATLFFQIAHYAIRPWPWILVALCSLVLYPDLGADDKKLGFVMAMRDFLPSGFRGLLLVAFLAAYMSTISTQLNWGASYLVGDVYKRFINKKASDKDYVLFSRLSTLGIAIIAFIVTLKLTTIKGAWEFIIECGAGLGLVLILRWYWWRINAWSEISATIAPFVAYSFAKFALGWEFPNSFFLTVGFTTLTWVLVTYLTPPTKKEVLEAFYKKVKPDGAWQPIRTSLGIAEQPSQIGTLLVCWLSSVVFVYSILFGVGYIVLQEWESGIYCTASSILSYFVMQYFSQKVQLFK